MMTPSMSLLRMLSRIVLRSAVVVEVVEDFRVRAGTKSSGLVVEIGGQNKIPESQRITLNLGLGKVLSEGEEGEEVAEEVVEVLALGEGGALEEMVEAVVDAIVPRDLVNPDALLLAVKHDNISGRGAQHLILLWQCCMIELQELDTVLQKTGWYDTLLTRLCWPSVQLLFHRF